jgi:hypothetical protein
LGNQISFRIPEDVARDRSGRDVAWCARVAGVDKLVAVARMGMEAVSGMKHSGVRPIPGSSLKTAFAG